MPCALLTLGRNDVPCLLVSEWTGDLPRCLRLFVILPTALDCALNERHAPYSAAFSQTLSFVGSIHMATSRIALPHPKQVSVKGTGYERSAYMYHLQFRPINYSIN